MSIELALADCLCLQTGKTAKFPAIKLARTEAALGEKLHKLGIAEATVVLWQVQGVVWGRWKNGALELAGGAEKKPLLWLDMRVFNEEAELHLKKQGDMWLGRCLKDGEGEPVEYVDSIARFWGRKTKDEPGGCMRLEDTARKLQLVLPQVEESAAYYGLVTRSYIGYETTGQAGYKDCRYMRIAAADVEGGMEDGTAR